MKKGTEYNLSIFKISDAKNLKSEKLYDAKNISQYAGSLRELCVIILIGLFKMENCDQQFKLPSSNLQTKASTCATDISSLAPSKPKNTCHKRYIDKNYLQNLHQIPTDEP